MAGRSGKETSDDHKYLSSRGCTSLKARVPVPWRLGVADRRESESGRGGVSRVGPVRSASGDCVVREEKVSVRYHDHACDIVD